MSPKHCSLAFDEVQEIHRYEDEVAFEPQLKILINPRYKAAEEVVVIAGEITVSF